jgi:oligopeptide transport system permease protein
MIRYTVKRVGIAFLTVFMLATITFFLLKVLPGDPFLNPKVPKAVQERQVAYYGLDKPVLSQYLIYMGNLIRGNMGTSLKYVGRQVTGIIANFFPVSATLGLCALIFSELTGLLFGILSAQFKDKWADYALMIFAILGIALPSMVIGPLLRFFLGVKLHILPVSGWGEPAQVIMPAFVLGLSTIAANTRSMRACMLGVSTQDFIKTARSKGLTGPQIVMRHELKNSLVPMLSGLGPAIASVLMGSFVVEQIFVIPGLGKHFVDAVSTLDYPLVMGLTIFYGAFLVVMNLLVDLLYGALDPRIRLE